MHGLLASHAEVKVSCVLHLVCVARLLDPVANGVAVHPIHHVIVIIHAAAVMMWSVAW